MKRSLRGALVFALLIISSVLCGELRAAEIVRFRIPSDLFETLDWNKTPGTGESGIVENVMEGLVRYDEKMQLVPALAESWEISPDRLKYTFTLRKDVVWSDGKPLTAAHFRDSWIRALQPSTHAHYSSYLFDIRGAEAFHQGKLKDPAQVGIVAKDARTLEVTLAAPVSYFLHRLGFWVTYPVRLDLIRKHGAKWTDPARLVTLGPYQLVSWKKGQSIQFRRNPRYYGAAPAVETVEAVVEPSPDKARGLMKRGEIDFLLNPATSDLLELGELIRMKQARIASFSYMSTFYLAFNVQDRVFQSVDMRKAVSDSLDRPALAAETQAGFFPASSFVAPQIPGHDDSPPARSSISPRGLMQKSGFFEGKGVGRPTLWIEATDYAQKLTRGIAEQLKSKLGIEIDVKVASPAERTKSLKEEKYSIYVLQWAADFPDPANFYEVFTRSGGPTRTAWQNARYDALVTQANVASDLAERLKLYRQAEDILVTDQAVIFPLFYRKNVAIVGSRLESFEVSPLNYLHFRTFKLRRN